MKTLKRWLDENPGIKLPVWLHVPLLLYALGALPFDQREILGLNPWIKPLKFDLSVIVFLFTAGGILSGLDGWRRSRLVIGWCFGIAMIVEDYAISMQSFRGVRSHMNFSTLFDGMTFATMGIFIAINTLAAAWLLALLCFNRTRWSKPVAWGVRLGLLAFVAGSLEGVLMVTHGAHTVGAPDGSAGLYFLNWSTQYGDLRIAHFFAIHALQAMPLLGWFVGRTALPERIQPFPVLVGFVAYMGVTFALFQQAMGARPLL